MLRRDKHCPLEMCVIFEVLTFSFLSKDLSFWQEDCVLKRRRAHHSTYGKYYIVNNITLIIFTFSEVSTAKMSKRGRGGAAGAKFRISLACPVGAVMNCADNTGAKNL